MCTERGGSDLRVGGICFRDNCVNGGGWGQLYFLTSRESVCAVAAWQMAFVSNG